MSVETFSSSDREFLRHTYASKDWVDVYDLHIEYQLSPGQIVDIVERLREGRLVEFEGTKARLTAAGREWLFKQRNTVFKSAASEFRAELEESILLEPTTQPGEPYLPNLAEVDREFFEALALPEAG